MYCIYRITNSINGHSYIGQHKYEDESNPMGKYKGSGLLLHKAYAKYGIENFTTKILYKRIRDKSTVDAMEIWAIEKYKPEYNIAKGGSGGDTYSCSSEEKKKLHCERLSNALKGRKCPWIVEKNWKNKFQLNTYWNAWIEENEKIINDNKHFAYHRNKNKLSSYWNAWIYENEKILTQSKISEIRREAAKRLKNRTSPTRGKHWFTDGKTNVMCYECPQGFRPGYQPSEKQIARGMRVKSL